MAGPIRHVEGLQRAVAKQTEFRYIRYGLTPRGPIPRLMIRDAIPSGWSESRMQLTGGWSSSSAAPSSNGPRALFDATRFHPRSTAIAMVSYFFGGVLTRHPDYVDALRIMGNLLALKGRTAEGMQIDKRLVQLRPSDPLAHYNLACSYALLKRSELAIKTLRRAVELGYRDFRYMREDHDLDSIRHDPRFRQLMREYENR